MPKKKWLINVAGLVLVSGCCGELTSSNTQTPIVAKFHAAVVRRSPDRLTGRPSATELATDYAIRGRMDTGRALTWNTAVGYAFAKDRDRAIHIADVYRHLPVVEQGAYFDQRRQVWVAVVLYGPGNRPYGAYTRPLRRPRY